MRKTVIRLNAAAPIVDHRGYPQEQFRVFLLQVQELGLIIGTGSPEGVVEAEQGVEYMDENGTAGTIKYIKRDAHVGGDRSLGWILI